MAPKVGVVLSGCGFLAGSEVTEAVLSLYFLDRAGAQVVCFAPDRDQLHVVNHLTGEPTGETRNVRTEAARIARGAVEPLSGARMADLDALVLPGGYGAAKNLSDFAIRGADCDLDPDLRRLLREALEAHKPIAAICISPAVLAAAAHRSGHTPTLTIGTNADVSQAIEALGCHHEECPVDEIVADEQHRVVTCPAYMEDAGPGSVGAGIGKAIDQLMAWLR